MRILYLCIIKHREKMKEQTITINNKIRLNHSRTIIKSNEIPEELATPSRQGGEIKTTRPLRTLSWRRTTMKQIIHIIYIYVCIPTRAHIVCICTVYKTYPLATIHRGPIDLKMAIRIIYMYIQDGRRHTSASGESRLQRKFQRLSALALWPRTPPPPIPKYIHNTTHTERVRRVYIYI